MEICVEQRLRVVALGDFLSRARRAGSFRAEFAVSRRLWNFTCPDRLLVGRSASTRRKECECLLLPDMICDWRPVLSATQYGNN